MQRFEIQRLRYDTLSTVRNDSLEIEEFWPYQDYENLSFSYLDFLKDDIISPALENSSGNSNSTISTTDNFPIFNTDPTPQQRLVNLRTVGLVDLRPRNYQALKYPCLLVIVVFFG